ncbi:hypothetical protein INT45_012960 [Circinella minor]|uniref:Uncharacterized protein n=1 Tax=Circinella minor TaxID=1195481 RepID=A0A8H7RQR7_9FUNG|nr:hypothetical protein INT45_012960 [Circinella minor]
MAQIVEEEDYDQDKEDWQLLGLSEEDVNNAKDSRTLQWRKRKRDEADMALNSTSHSLLDFPGFTIQASSEVEVEEHKITPNPNSTSVCNTRSSFETCRLQCIHRYFTYRLQNMKKTKASTIAAKEIWGKPSSYRPLAIQSWAAEYIEFGFISPHRQGKHAKRFSFLSDEDIAESVRTWLQNQRPEQRNLVDLKKYIDRELTPTKLGVLGNVCLMTLRNYLHKWGYTYRPNKKDMYFDGHERPAVVEYRIPWAKRIMEYKKLMKEYTDDTIIEPKLEPGQQELVLVTQDESTFYVNDSKRDMWLKQDENLLRKKNPGMSIMVSEFQCVCHGTMHIKGWMSRKTFCAGQNRDGYWQHGDLLEQLESDVIPLFEALHPGAKGVFIFDQSANHGAFSDDALVTSRMPLKPKPADEMKPYKFRDTTYIREGKSYEQTMYINQEMLFETKKGKEIKKTVLCFKGVQKILDERGLWFDNDPYRKGKKWRLFCNDTEKPDHRCCARHLLESQPDFINQKSALQEMIEENHIFEMYPKFH